MINELIRTGGLTGLSGYGSESDESDDQKVDKKSTKKEFPTDKQKSFDSEEKNNVFKDNKINESNVKRDENRGKVLFINFLIFKCISIIR